MSVTTKTLEERIDSLQVLHSVELHRLGNYPGESYHLALLNVASGQQFLAAVSNARRKVVLTFIDRAARRQSREACDLRWKQWRNRQDQEVIHG